MSVSLWAYEPELCDGQPCPGDCDHCDRWKDREEVLWRKLENVLREQMKMEEVFWRELEALKGE